MAVQVCRLLRAPGPSPLIYERSIWLSRVMWCSKSTIGAGHIEVNDQLDGVRFLASRPYVDSTRVGIYGWSYGGYMTCRALLQAPEVFKVGIAGAPVTFWEGYDTHYTERYMGFPATNEAGYLASSVLPYVEQLAGKLMLVQGLADENVHARHIMRLIEALTTAARDYELVLFPEARHMPRNTAHLEYLERQLVEFLNRHLEKA